MNDPRLARAEAIRVAILDLLFERWNPAAVTDRVAAADVHAPLAGPLYRLIAGGASPLRLAEELAESERRIGRTTAVAELLPVGCALADLDVRL